MSCTKVTVAEGCLFDSATNLSRSILIHTTYGDDASGKTIVTGVYYTEADSSVVINKKPTETATAGACQPMSSDVEWVQLCDKDLADPASEAVQFFRKYTRTSTAFGVVSETVEDFEADLETAYTVVNDVASCGSGDAEAQRITLCDATGTAFIRLVRDMNGVQVSVGDFELDGVTAYNPTVPVGACPTCAPAVAGGLKTAWGV